MYTYKLSDNTFKVDKSEWQKKDEWFSTFDTYLPYVGNKVFSDGERLGHWDLKITILKSQLVLMDRVNY